MNAAPMPDASPQRSTSIEARLSAITTTPAPAQLRRRVLAAVDAVLNEPPADNTHDEAQWSLLATAAAAMLLVASWGGSLGLGQSIAGVVSPHPVSLTERMANAEIKIESSGQAQIPSARPVAWSFR